MNRGTLNSAPIGSGSRGNLVHGLISGGMELAGSVRASVTKYGSAATDHVLFGAVRAHQWVASKATSSHDLVGDVIGRALRHVYGAAVQFHHALSSVLGRRELSGAVEQDHLLETRITPIYWHAVHGGGVIEHRLIGDVSGVDLNYEPAPRPRRVAVINVPRRVAVAGSDNSMGV